jgi:catechol 2,3-dioxygenase-like lactoylglutathione lyase family enzyme
MKRMTGMIEGLSHMTFVVRDLDKTTELYKALFDARVVYDSGDKTHSLYRERFLLVGGLWIAVMENREIVNRTYHHVAFKIREEDAEKYMAKIRELGLEMRPPRPRIKGEGLSIYFYDYDNNLFELHTGTLEERLAAYREADGQM